MGLHLEHGPSLYKPFEREMRRRLWWQICLLESHAADDRATTPAVFPESFNTRLPLQINDEDIQIGSLEEEVVERHGFTDMTFNLICFEAQDLKGQLNYAPVRKLGFTRNQSLEDSAQRIDAVINVQKRIEDRYLRHLNLSRPFHWATRLVADIMIATLWLIVYRPLLQSSDHAPPKPADPGILDLSVEVLERGYRLNTDPAASSFRWLSETYVHWHGLAVTIAELCTKTEGPMVERAWAIVMPAFEQASQHVADSQGGMLWRPIKKLMNKAQTLRKEHLDSQSTNNDLSAKTMNLGFSNQSDHLKYTRDSNQSVQQVDNGFVTNMEGLEMPAMSGHAPYNWDPWLAAASTSGEPSMGGSYNNHMDQLAWTNWESFVDGFQGQDEITLSGANGNAADLPNFWP